MIIRHNLPSRRYTKIDRDVFLDYRLSDGAVRLYGFLCGLRNGANFTDAYIVKAMRISQRALSNRKKELKEAHLALVDQIGARIYVIYIGHSRLSAEEVKAQWDIEDADKS